MNVKRLAYDAMLAAICTVLGYLSIDMGNMKFTFESFPILLGALLFGPVDGMLIAFVGTFLYQVLKWGLMSTTMLWVIPYVIIGLLVGLFYKKELKKPAFFALIIGSGVLLTALNTVGLYLDTKIWDYYSFAYVFAPVPIRLLVSVIKSVVFAIILPLIIEPVKKTLHS